MKTVKRNVSGRDFENLKTLLKKAILKEGFSILAEYDFKKILTSKGMKLEGNAYVVDMCNPSNAEKILASKRTFGIYLPCKIGIFEEENGEYSVIYPDPLSSIETDNPVVQTSLKEVSNVLKRIAMAPE